MGGRPTADGAGGNGDPARDPARELLLEHRLESRLSALETLAAAVSAALPERADLAFKVNLCLEEIIANIIRHGLGGAPGHEIRVRLSCAGDRLEVTVEDDAPRYDPFAQAPVPDLELDLERRPVGGLGVHLVKTLMDRVRAEHHGAGNRIVLEKKMPPRGANEESTEE